MSLEEKLKHLEEISIPQFLKTRVVSDSTLQYANERKAIMGQAPTNTRLMETQIDGDNVRFTFYVYGTEKYPDDHQYMDANPEKGFQLERNPIALYEIYLQFDGAEKLKRGTLNLNEIKNFILTQNFKLFSNSPSFHWNGSNYFISQMGAGLYPTDIKPEKPSNKDRGPLDKHTYLFFESLKWFIPQMAGSLLNRLRTQGYVNKYQRPKKPSPVPVQPTTPTEPNVEDETGIPETDFDAKVQANLNQEEPSDNQETINMDTTQQAVAPAPNPTPTQVATPVSKKKDPNAGLNADITKPQEKSRRNNPGVLMNEDNEDPLAPYQDMWTYWKENPKEYRDLRAKKIYSFVDKSGEEKTFYHVSYYTKKHVNVLNIHYMIQGDDGTVRPVNQWTPEEKLMWDNIRGVKYIEEGIVHYSRIPTGYEAKFTINEKEFKLTVERNTGFLESSITDYNSKTENFFFETDKAMSWRTRFDVVKNMNNITELGVFISGHHLDTLLERNQVKVNFNKILTNIMEHDDFDIASLVLESGDDGFATLILEISKDWNDVGFKTFNLVDSTNLTPRSFIFKEDELYNSLFKKVLKEQGDSKTLVMAYGSFSPPTADHISFLRSMIATGEKANADVLLFLQPSEEFETSSTTLNQEQAILRSIDGLADLNVCLEEGIRDIYDALTFAYSELKYESIILMCGSDQELAYQTMVQENNGQRTPNGFFKFKSIKVLSSGRPNPDKSPQAIAAKNAILSGDFKAFIKGANLPYVSSFKNLFDLLRYGVEEKIGV